MLRNIVPALTGRTVRCILFDLGNTLWTYNTNAMHALEQIAQQNAITLLHRYINTHSSSTIDDPTFIDQLFDSIEQQMYAPRPDMSVVPDVITATANALEALGFSHIERNVAEEVYEALRDSIPETRILFEDTISTLATLQERGFLLNIVSNRGHGGSAFRTDMLATGLQDYFDLQKIAISIDVGSNKPDPYIFQYALAAFDVKPEEAVMVGDRLGADVVGAKHLGIFAVWKPSPRLFEQARAEILKQPVHISSSETHIREEVFNIAEQHEQDYIKAVQVDYRPDLIIEHLSELLDVFVQPGKQ